MRYIFILFFLVGCTEERPMPKVGECYERYFKGHKLDSYEYVKIIKVDLKSKYDAIHYIYNIPSSSNFEKGKWYTIPALTKESKDWFYGLYDYKVVNKIKCPW